MGLCGDGGKTSMQFEVNYLLGLVGVLYLRGMNHCWYVAELRHLYDVNNVTSWVTGAYSLNLYRKLTVLGSE
jgi:hypothetical protein